MGISSSVKNKKEKEIHVVGHEEMNPRLCVPWEGEDQR